MSVVQITTNNLAAKTRELTLQKSAKHSAVIQENETKNGQSIS